jgi:hypothetical protein
MSEAAELRQRRQARRAARTTEAAANNRTSDASVARTTTVPTAGDEPTPSMAADLRREARRAVPGGTASHDAWALSQGVPQTMLTRFRETEGAANPDYDGRQADRFPVEAGTDAVVPLALTSARPQSQWKQPLLEHVRAPDNQIVAVPRENWVHGGYAREPASDTAATPMADTLRDRREQRKTERIVARHEAQKEMNRALEERAKEERLAELRQMERQLQARMEEAQQQLDEAQALSRGAKAQVDSQAPASHKRQIDMHKDGKKNLKKDTLKIKEKRAKERERILTQPAEVDTRPSAAAAVQRRLAQTAPRRVQMRGGQLDGSGWRKDALVLKHEKFLAAARAGKRPGVDAGDRGGTKRSWLNWEGAGKGGRALAVQQKFARKRPTLRVLARLRREAEAKAHAEVGMAAQQRRREGGGIVPRRLSLRPSAGYRAGYHEHSERGKNPTVISPWDAGHRQNVHDRKLAEVQPRITMQLDEPVARIRTSLASDAAAALRQSTGSNWEAEARIRDEKHRRPFARTPSSVNVAKTLHDRRVQRAVKEVDAGGPQDKSHAKLVKMAKEPGRAGWQAAATAPGAQGPLEGRTVAAVAERAYWHRLRIDQARAGRDNRQSLFGPNAPAFKVAVSKKPARSAEEPTAAKQTEEELRRQQEFGWVAPVPTAETLRRTSTGLFPKAAAGGTPLQDTPLAKTRRNTKTKHPTLYERDPGTAGNNATERPGWAGAATGGPRDQCPPGSHRRMKGVYLDPENLSAHMKRHRKRVASARQNGNAALREGLDGTKGAAWRLKENRNRWRQQRMRQQRVFEATAATRARKIPKSLGGGGETGVMNPREQQPPPSKWSAAARELASHRMRVAELLSQEDESDNEALTASQVPVVREVKEEAALAVGVYPIGVGEVLSAAAEGGSASGSEDEEVERLLLKYAAASAGWHSSDDENDETRANH